jgi:hypothetical protein
MSGEVEHNKCDICGFIGAVNRKYYHYPIKCECHSPQHFELVIHCNNCIPTEPTVTKLTVKTEILTHFLKDESLREDERSLLIEFLSTNTRLILPKGKDCIDIIDEYLHTKSERKERE